MVGLSFVGGVPWPVSATESSVARGDGLGAGLKEAASAASDATCQTQDLNAAFNSPLRSMPIHDQDGSGTCYAYAAAQLIDYYRIRHGSPSSDRIHPIAAAWATYSQTHTNLSGGRPSDVITALRKSRVCSASTVEDRFRELKAACGNITDAQLNAFLEELYSHGGRIPANIPICLVSALQAVLRIDNLMAMNTNAVYMQFFHGCRQTDLSALPAPRQHNADPASSVIDGEVGVIDLSLRSGYPASVALCSNFFTNVNYRHRGVSPRPPCSAHAIVITGRRVINGACNYLVRNSWGARWRAPPPPASSACACIVRGTNAYKEICTPAEAQEYVGCWFSQDVIGKNVLGITTIR